MIWPCPFKHAHQSANSLVQSQFHVIPKPAYARNQKGTLLSRTHFEENTIVILSEVAGSRSEATTQSKLRRLRGVWAARRNPERSRGSLDPYTFTYVQIIRKAFS